MRSSRASTLAVAVLMHALLHCALWEAARAQSARPFARHVLALSDQHTDNRSGGPWSPVHVLLQMPLNHLGMSVSIASLEDGPPPAVDPDHTRAILVHLAGAEPAPDWLLPWLRAQRKQTGVRVIHFGSLDTLSENAGELHSWLRELGLSHRPTTVDNPMRVTWRPQSRDVAGFEATPMERRHVGPQNIDERNRVWVETQDRRNPDDRRAPIVTGQWGGVALQPWAYSPGVAQGDRRWHLQPFAFFVEALGLRGMPAPEPCVAFGRRKFILHIDGDGFESMSSTMPGKNAASVFVERIVETTAIPMTLSVIIRSVTDDLAVSVPTEEMQLAQRMFDYPWVESATHTVLHPLNWRGRLTPRSLPRSVLWYDDGSLQNYEHDMRAEVVQSVQFINRHLAPEDRPCRVVLWSGLANPSRDVIAACSELDCINLNGGVYRFDASHPSVGYVQPWGLQLQDQFQVYCGAANENVFDGFYSTLPTAFEHIHQTLENTGSPRILKPANIYAHFYSAEHEPRLRAFSKLVEEWSVRRKTVPVFASAYARAIDNAQHGCEITQVDDGFRFAGFDACRTVRFDAWAQADRHVDWRLSDGVVGANVIGDSLFVQLGASEARLVWAPMPVLAPHLIDANHVLVDIERSAETLIWRSRAFRDRATTVGGLPASTSVLYRINGEVRNGETDEDGRMVIRLVGAGDDRLEVQAP